MLKLLFDTNGRIGRARFWLGMVLLLIGGFVIFGVLVALGFGHTESVTTTTTVGSNPPATTEGWKSTLSPWGNFIFQVVELYPGLALCLKRRHDRDNAGYDLMVVTFAALVLALFNALDLGLGILSGLLGAVVFFGLFYLFVVLGLLRGTPGPNRFGADPLLNP